jgi:DNA-binding transcriptional ArsR family regulator
MRSRTSTDPVISAIARLIGDPSRAAILMALSEGQARPAGELARDARISPQTASAHLDKLFRAKLLTVEIQGRHQYYRLTNREVARALESLAVLAPPAPHFTTSHSVAASALRFARLCYDHLAGRLGVDVTRALCEHGHLRDGDAGYAVTAAGWAWLSSLGIAAATLRADRRPLTRQCLDWSERRHHLAGGLGAALATYMLDRGWLSRVRGSRAVRLTDRGCAALRGELGLRYAGRL